MDKKTMLIRKKNIFVFLCMALAFIFIAILSISCQRSQAQEVKKGGQVQKEDAKQPQTVEPISEEQSKKAQGANPKESKGPSPLTEEEQKEFKEFMGAGWQGPGDFETEEQAIKYLKILLKGNEKTIRWYQEAREEGKMGDEHIKYVYSTHLAIALSAIHTGTNKEGYNLAVEVLKTKRDYPEALASAAEKAKFAHDPSVIPVLREIANYPVPSVRLQAAGSLLSLGDGETALPVLDELVEKEGYVQALYYLFSAPGKIIDERGYKILEKALNNPRAEIRISATKLLLESKKIKKEKAEEIALGILEDLKGKTIKDYGFTPIPKYPPAPDVQGAEIYYSNWRACDYTISLLSDVKSSKAIPILEFIRDNNTEWWYVCQRGVKEAIKAIEKKGDRK